MQKKLAETHGPTSPTGKELKRQEEVTRTKQQLQDTLNQQKDLASRATSLVGGATHADPEIQALVSAINHTPITSSEEHQKRTEQQKMVEQLRVALTAQSPALSGDW